MNPQNRMPQPDIRQPHADALAYPHTHTHHRPASALGRLRPSPARSLLGAGVLARLGLAAAALVLLWTTILWALR
ncbi:MAG: hypothetical protein KA225_02735 [Thauera sp.]|nr:hypothetical protein [Thauera sp.]